MSPSIFLNCLNQFLFVFLPLSMTIRHMPENDENSNQIMGATTLS